MGHRYTRRQAQKKEMKKRTPGNVRFIFGKDMTAEEMADAVGRIAKKYGIPVVDNRKEHGIPIVDSRKKYRLKTHKKKIKK